MIIINIDGLEQAQRQLLRIIERGGNLSPVFSDMGEHMVNSTHDNFENSTTPDGEPWAANSEATFASMLGASDTNKSGRLNRRGSNRVASKQPLIMNHTLMQSIHYEAASAGVTIGTNMVYGAMMHFGGTKEEFPHLWGDIPARNYLGASSDDATILTDLITNHLIE